MNSIFYSLLALGVVLSIYTLYLHWKIAKQTSYKAACDLSKLVSCTKVIKDPHAKIFGIPNGVYGIVFYILFGEFYFYGQSIFSTIMAIMGILMSLYFAYCLYKIKTWCLICITIYTINIALFFLIIFK